MHLQALILGKVHANALFFYFREVKKWACTHRNRGECHFMTFRWRENVQSTFLFYIM